MDKPAAGIILAAGGSKRLGTPKQLVKYKGEFLINRVIDLAMNAHLDPIIVVLGADFEIIKRNIRAKNCVTIVRNTNWEEGQSTSLRIGAETIQHLNIPFIFMLCDHPYLKATTVQCLVNTFYDASCEVVITEVKEKLLPPVIFSPKCIHEIKNIKGDRGARSIVEKFDYKTCKEADGRLLIDIDTREDLEKLI